MGDRSGKSLPGSSASSGRSLSTLRWADDADCGLLAPGYCLRCQQWLAYSKDIRPLEHSIPSYNENDAALWHTKTVAELLAAAHA